MPSVPELHAHSLDRFLEPLHDLFRRSESRAALAAYVAGLMSGVECKTATAIARVVPGTSSQRLQEFLTRTSWDAAELARRRAACLRAQAACGPRTIVVDAVAIPKTGAHSVGASRQCRGPRGGAVTCQRVVVTHHVDRAFDWPLSARLYLPVEWTASVERRSSARVPPGIVHAQPLDIARAMLDAAAREASSPVVFGPGFADDPGLAAALDAARPPWIAVLGAGVRVRVGSAARNAADAHADVARGAWERVAWRDRDGVSRVRECAVTPARLDETGREGILLLLRHLAEPRRPVAYFAAGLRPDEALSGVCDASTAAAAYYRGEARSFGFDDYEGRLWVGFERHVALVHLASAYRLLHDAAR